LEQNKVPREFAKEKNWLTDTNSEIVTIYVPLKEDGQVGSRWLSWLKACACFSWEMDHENGQKCVRKYFS